MSTIISVLPAAACAALMGIPMTIGMTRRWLRRRGKAIQPESTPAPVIKAMAESGRR
jgi:hypothetical protein